MKKNKYPLVTVITVVRNDVEHIEETIRSVTNQNYPHIEYIIIDGASTDGTLDIIKQHKNYINVMISEPDKGIYDAMNKGITHARGKWLHFLHSGDVFVSASVLLDLIDSAQEGFDILYANALLVSEKNKLADQRRHKSLSRWYLLHNTICQQAMLIKKELFDIIGSFNMSYPLKADYEWLLRYFFTQKNKSCYIDTDIVRYRLGGISDDADRDRYEKIKIVEAFFSPIEIFYYTLKNIKSLVKMKIRKHLYSE